MAIRRGFRNQTPAISPERHERMTVTIGPGSRREASIASSIVCAG